MQNTVAIFAIHCPDFKTETVLLREKVVLCVKQGKESSGNCQDRLGKSRDFSEYKVKKIFILNFHWCPGNKRAVGRKKGAEIYGNNSWFFVRSNAGPCTFTCITPDLLIRAFTNLQAIDTSEREVRWKVSG